MAEKETVLLQSYDNRNAGVSTRWGVVKFDDKGFANLAVAAADKPMLRNLGWLVEPKEPAAPAPQAVKAPEAVVAKAPEAVAKAPAITVLDIADPAPRRARRESVSPMKRRR